MSKRDLKRMNFCIERRIKELMSKGIGTSKHMDKLENGGKPLPEKIYSYKTADTYRDCLKRFAKAAAVDGHCHNMEQAKDYVAKWLQERVTEGYSAWTVRTEASALAKYYGCKAADFGVYMPIRHQYNAVQHRRPETVNGRFNPDNNRDLVDFCRACGLRRHEVAALTPDKVMMHRDGSVTVRVIGGKGGKNREVLCLNSRPYEIAQAAARRGDSLVFPHVHTAAPIHYYRGCYARELYRRCAVDVSKLPPSKVYHCRGQYLGQVFDKTAVKVVTQQLGHARLGVTVLAYLASYQDIED